MLRTSIVGPETTRRTLRGKLRALLRRPFPKLALRVFPGALYHCRTMLLGNRFAPATVESQGFERKNRRMTGCVKVELAAIGTNMRFAGDL